MNKTKLLLGLAHMVAAMDSPLNHYNYNETPNIKGVSSMSEDEKMKRKGLKKFYIGNDEYVWALNEKSAIKKWNKRNKS